MRYIKNLIAAASMGLLVSCAGGNGNVESHIADVPAPLMTQIPAAENNFEWRLYKNALFQIPKNWNENEIISESSGIPIFAYGASEEQFSKNSFFEMGITVQVIEGSNKIKGIESSKMAALYLKPLIDAHKKEEILMLDQKTKGKCQNYFFRYKDSANGQKPIIVHKFIMACNELDAVYAFTFESPEGSWEKNWEKYGTPFLKKVMLVQSQ